MRLEFFNESMIFTLIYHLMFFTTQHIEITDLRYIAGNSLIGFTIFLIFINIMVLVIPAVKGVILHFRIKWHKKKHAEYLEKNKKAAEAIKLSDN